MARPLIHSARVLRTGAPLGLEAIKQVAPAVFALQAHDSRGPRYAYVPTVRPLETLLDNGWGVYEASQQRARAADRDPYTKHMLRLRKISDWQGKASADGVPEVVLINAHDGTAAYHLFAGFFRFVCSNGLIAGTTLAGFKVRHTVGLQTSNEVLLAGEAVVTEKFPVMMSFIDRLRSKAADTDMQMRLAEKAMRLRYGQTVAPFPATDLLAVRREEDKDPTLWNMLNRIQENILNGGWETRSAMYARRSAVRPVERVTAVASINGGLWDEAIAIAEEA
jgi:hypothetical protein